MSLNDQEKIENQLDSMNILLSGEDIYQTKKLVLASLVRVLEIFGDPWSVLLLRDAFLGVKRFDQFQKRLGINRQTLASRLKNFVEKDIFLKLAYQDRPVRYEYILSPRARNLYFFGLTVWKWQSKWTPKEDNILPLRLYHRPCGELLLPLMVCNQCLQPVSADTIKITAKEKVHKFPKLTGRGRRWSGESDRRRSSEAQQVLRATTIIGDRWVNLIVAAMLLGIRSFDEIVRTLGIATNILSHRLTVLSDAGLVGQPIYSPEKLYFEYPLTDSSRQLLPMFMTLAQWSDDWTQSDDPRPEWIHKSCGKPFRAIMIDETCKAPILANAVDSPELNEFAFEA